MARVYRAYHPQLDRYVAVKVLRSDLADEDEFLDRFQREARAVAALRHANIVQVYDFDVQDDLYYMVMELLEGDTLRVRLSDYRTRGERMPLGEMVRVLLDVLDGMAYAHSEGMIHRDIKPGNILLTQRGQAVVADFGIAQIVGGTRHTAVGALMGTLHYIAPEQGLKGQSDARSDIYSLGIVLYEILTQRTPFDADTPLAVLMKHVNDPLPLPRTINPDIPESFERIVLKALAKSPDDRYQSAEEMAQALREAAEGEELELPSRISLPLSFTTSDAPSESVAVFSGTARERLSDAEFATDDTDAHLGQRLAAEGATGVEGLRGAGRELWGAVGAVAGVAVSKTAQALREAARKAETESMQGRPPTPPEPPTPFGDVPSDMPDAQFAVEQDGDVLGWEQAARGARVSERAAARAERRAEGRRRRGSVGLAILGALGLVAMANMCMVTVAAPTDNWLIFEQGWPVEILLGAWGLCVIMYVTSTIWLLIPIGPAFVTGLLLAYSQLTGDWEHWNYTWVVEAWAALICIVTPIFLAGNKGLARGLSRVLAILISLACIAAILTIALSVGLDSLFSSFLQ
jgi:tRNA A-37 threonylcarbamoyl transferase component Bud32